jgi:hypothetical protein
VGRSYLERSGWILDFTTKIPSNRYFSILLLASLPHTFGANSINNKSKRRDYRLLPILSP